MRVLLSLALLFGGISLALATPIREEDNYKIVFATATVGGVPAFSLAEKAALQAARPGDPVVNLTPTAFEISLSTTITDLRADQFRLYLTSKPDIVDKVIELETQLSAMEHFIGRYPAFTAAATPKMNKLKAQINALVAIYNTL